MDDGDEIIVLRVVTVDMNGNITRQLQPSFTDEYAIDKKGNIQALLQQEERQARDNASIVMERIMANSGPDKKVTSDDKQTKYWTLSLDQCHYWICYRQSARNHSAYGKSLRKWDIKGGGGGCLCYVIGFRFPCINHHCSLSARVVFLNSRACYWEVYPSIVYNIRLFLLQWCVLMTRSRNTRSRRIGWVD